MEYVRTAASVAVQLFGPQDAGYLLHLTGWLIGMQFYDDVSKGFSVKRGTAQDFAAFLHMLFEAEGDAANLSVAGDGFEVRQQAWKLMAEVADYHPACAKALEGLVEGLAAGSGRRIAVGMKMSAGGSPPFVWSIA